VTGSDPIGQLRERGWCVVEGVIPPAALDRCYYDGYRILTTCGVIAPAYPRNMSWQLRALELIEDVIHPARADDILKEQFYIRPAYVNDVPSFARFLADGRLLETVRAYVGPEPRITFTTLYVHEPGTARGPWHGGGPFHPLYAAHYPSPYENAAPHLTAHLLMSEFSGENGGLLLVPGSHRRVTNPAHDAEAGRCAPQPDEATATAPTGSVILTDSRLWRAVAPNAGDFSRMSVTIEFAPARERLPDFLARAKSARLNPGVFDRLPPAVRPLFSDWQRSA
jgi:hypothetical protein